MRTLLIRTLAALALTFGLVGPFETRAQEPTLPRELAAEIVGHLTSANQNLDRLQVLLSDPENWNDVRFQRPALHRIVIIQRRIDNLIERVDRAARREVSPKLLLVLDKETLELLFALIVLNFEAAEPAGSLGDAIREEIESASSLLNAELFALLNVELFCFDRIDNDGDGLIDGDDPDCR